MKRILIHNLLLLALACITHAQLATAPDILKRTFSDAAFIDRFIGSYAALAQTFVYGKQKGDVDGRARHANELYVTRAQPTLFLAAKAAEQLKKITLVFVVVLVETDPVQTARKLGPARRRQRFCCVCRIERYAPGAPTFVGVYDCLTSWKGIPHCIDDRVPIGINEDGYRIPFVA